ncbi:MAG TPA: TAXI family TRAP transporter solute-binding subunit [Syntrophales bacterium]|nr:TAXI family TRAP transporter solute-binding subunit [Syntrophobacterales bacterium]HQL90142.1 TAXI family TRAP transporter solute-binding subunit [Syntrophales bacterium]
MKKRAFLVVSIVLALTLVLAGTSIAQQKKFFVISTGGTGGTYYPLGGILAQALSQAVPEVVVTSQAGNASVANCNLIRDKQVESAFVQSNVAYNAFNGLEQFKEKPVKNLRFIASLYPETIQIVARADSGIKTVKDIKGKRLVPGDRGSGTEVDALNVLGAYGYTYKDFSSVDWLSFSGGAQRLQDKQADVTFTTAGWPTAAITELAISTNIVLVPIDEAKIKDLTKKFPFYARIVIPKGTYKGQEKDVATITTMAQWVVGAEVPDDVVYKLTKALWESGAKKMAEAHAQGKNVQPKTALAGMSIPLHPGAEKFYKEAGLIKAEPAKKSAPKKK